ncbi:OhcB2 (Protein with transmembrane helices) [Desulfamplus magnetovallimortis]|uniref:OhcB2 (Protein with transmembrane helices) n=1 Tax=Desulfamplus magnetovallimortis TaxID=1246637 RepID=A0A1W1H7Y8_9BACT|nr:hypothetical protein [Desulfamplus magnetovallimortis]SLM28600.1 OhcB2 (Protein with transmembrane helices) [Desulfamplus magnetovallimortis]
MSSSNSGFNERTVRFIYLLTFIFLVLSGFGQMPIFKRYYIADIPGFGWLAQFYVTHAIHYIFASVLIGLSCYVVLDHILDREKDRRITKTGYAKSVMLIGLMGTGGFMVYKNISGVFFPHNMIIALDIVHLGLCMILMFYSFYTVIAKKSWVRHPINDILQKME